MFAYFEKHTYMGPNSEEKIQLAQEIAVGDFNSLTKYINANS